MQSEFAQFSPAPNPQLKIGLCVETPRPELLDNLEENTQLCHLHIFGASVPSAAKNTLGDDPSLMMIQAFQQGEIDGFVRGVNDDFSFQKKLISKMGCDPLLRVAILQDAYNHQFALGPVSAMEGINPEERGKYGLRVCAFLSDFGIRPRIAVMTGCRFNSRHLNENNRRSWAEGEELVSRFQAAGYEATNFGIELDKAVIQCNFILPVNGLVGNQLYRAIVFLGAGKVLAVPAFPISGNIFRVCYEDNSRNENQYHQHICAAMAFAICRKNNS